MKKALGMMALGMGVGAGAVALYDQYKSGNLQKLVNKAEKKVDKMLDNMN
jgi:hypothetical protein